MKNSKLHTTEDKSNEKVTSSNSKSEDTEQYGRWRIHAKSVCSGYCPFHNPSNHPLKDAGINIRGDKMMLVERMCEHGIGHDDPDSVAYLQSKGEMWAGTHGCDGCCCEPPQDTSLTEITAEYFMATDPDRVALQRKVLAWHKAERAKLFEQIRSEAVRMNIPWGDGNGYDVVKAIDVEVLTRLEKK